MATTQYIGSRYVTAFADPIEWSNTKTYEALTVVQHNGDSYVSKQYVPTGIDISDARYWLHWADYNAQIEQYRRDVAQISEQMDELEEYTDERYNSLLESINNKFADKKVYLSDYITGTQTQRIKAAIAYAESIATIDSPVTVVFENKTYLVEEEIAYNPSIVSLDGNNCVLHFYNGTNGFVLSVNPSVINTAPRYKYVAIKDMELRGANYSNNGLTILSDTSRLNFSHVTVHGFDNGINMPIGANVVYMESFNNCYIYDNNYGVLIALGNDSGENINFNNCVIASNRRSGIRTYNFTKTIYLNHCSIDNNLQFQINAENYVSMVLSQCHIEFSGTYAFLVSLHCNIMVVGCNIINNGASVVVASDNTSACTFNNCTILKSFSDNAKFFGDNAFGNNVVNCVSFSTPNFHHLHAPFTTYIKRCQYYFSNTTNVNLVEVANGDIHVTTIANGAVSFDLTVPIKGNKYIGLSINAESTRTLPYTIKVIEPFSNTQVISKDVTLQQGVAATIDMGEIVNNSKICADYLTIRVECAASILDTVFAFHNYGIAI